MVETVVMSVGGSLINPGEINVSFLKRLKRFVEKSECRFILICGGGSNARVYAKAAKKFDIGREGQDWVGIAATMLNAELVRHLFGAPPVQQKPVKMKFGNVLVAGGWLPGCSTDYDAVLWAKKTGAHQIVNLSNTDYVYTKDPKKFKDAKPLKRLSWAEYKKLIASEWSAGLSTPFDPVASREAEKAGLRVALINGAKLAELKKFLKGDRFVGTVIE